MVLVHDFVIGMICCLYCCICWGSWANTQKLVQKKNWDYSLFYWDYIFGFLITAFIGAFTLGSMGNDGVSFLENISSADLKSIGLAFAAGVIWNLANVLLTTANAIAGMAVGFPIGGGFGWIGGVAFNYVLLLIAGKSYPGSEPLLWIGLVLGIGAILLCAKAYSNLTSSQKKTPTKGIVCALIAGIGFMFFYGLVIKALDPAYVDGGTGTLTPYTGVVCFALGAFLTTPIFNGFAMSHPVEGPKVSFSDYLKKGDARTHLIGMLGGAIWMSGMVISFMATGAGNPAVNYALSNASPLIAMIWGVFIWKEFKGAPKGTNKIVAAMFACFLIALVVMALSN